jgi:hypothetical protein
MKMTQAHLDDVLEAREEAEREAQGHDEWATLFSPGSSSAKKYAAGANTARCRAARLAEVAVHLAAQIEGADDAG